MKTAAQFTPHPEYFVIAILGSILFMFIMAFIMSRMERKMFNKQFKNSTDEEKKFARQLMNEIENNF